MTEPAAKPWLVKYDGPCARCGTLLNKGMPAVWDNARRGMHCVQCPDAQVAAEPPSTEVGVAGGSARREYERRSAKREAAIDERWGRLAGVVKAVTSEPNSTTAWATGARGEERLAQELATVDGLRILNDRSVSGTKGNIDHIVVAPAGVFVVDAKLYAGLIRVRNVGGWFRRDERLYVGSRDCTKLARGMAWQVDAVTAALESECVDPIPPVMPVLCFVDGEWPLLRPPRSFEGVRLATPRSLRTVIADSPHLGPERIDKITRVLASALRPK